MRNITIVFWGSLAALSLLWLLQATDVFTASGLFQWRGYLIQYSGILSIGCMSLAMLLALRPRWPERWLNGLDKMYRLHKWLGISGLVLAVAHWLIAIGPKWAIQWQLIVRPQRGQRPLPENELQAFLAQFRGLSKEMGEWAFYACIVLISISLIKAIPYGFFRKSHRTPASGLSVACVSLRGSHKTRLLDQPIGGRHGNHAYWWHLCSNCLATRPCRDAAACQRKDC